MKKNKLIISALLASLALSFFMFLPNTGVKADTLWDKQVGVDTIGQKSFGNSTPTDIRMVLVAAIRAFLSLLGIIFVVLLIWAGFKYMTSRGNEEKNGRINFSNQNCYHRFDYNSSVLGDYKLSN